MTLLSLTAGPNIETVGNADHYYVYFGVGVSTNKGFSNTWSRLPLGGSLEAFIQDAVIKGDPLGGNIFSIAHGLLVIPSLENLGMRLCRLTMMAIVTLI